MKGFKVRGAGFLAVCALLLVAMPVSAASAKGVLQLNEGETQASPEAPGFIAIDLASCNIENIGHLTGNDASTVKLTTTTLEDECGREGSTMTGELKEASMSSKGKLGLTGTLTVTEILPPELTCSYVYSKWKLTFKVPGPVEFGGTATGKLSKAVSSKGCPKTDTQSLSVKIVAIGDLKAFDAVVVP